MISHAYENCGLCQPQGKQNTKPAIFGISLGDWWRLSKGRWLASPDFLQGSWQLWLWSVNHRQNGSSVAFFSCATRNAMAPAPTKAWVPSPFPGPCVWPVALSLQRRQTARRIGVYVSFQAFTNTLGIDLACLSSPLGE